MSKSPFYILVFISIFFLSCSDNSQDPAPLITPTLSDTNLSIYENSPRGSAVGPVTVISSGDRDITSYTIQGADVNMFSINSQGLITLWGEIDYESRTSYLLEVYASSYAGDGEIATITVNINDVFEPIDSDFVHYGFGTSLDMSGDYITIGSEYSGSVHIYMADISGILMHNQELEPTTSINVASFGNSVSLSGDYLAVGAYKEDNSRADAGSAYIFKRPAFGGQYEEIAKLEASDPESYDYFGKSVSMSGDYIAVGASMKDVGLIDHAGSVYIFKRVSDDNITEIAKLEASDADSDDYFGNAVSMNGDYIVVGAYGEDGGVYDSGAIYIFKIVDDNNITEIAKIKADAQHGNSFGYSVSMNGDYIAVGAYNEGLAPVQAGAAYVYKIVSDENITRVAKLVADDAKEDDHFGNSIDINGDYIVVGANGDDTMNEEAGSAYIFKKDLDDNVTQIEKVFASTTSSGFFGSSVSVSGELLSVGAPGDGIIHLYKLDTIP